MIRRSGEVIDFCCYQEMSCKGGSAKMICTKFLWQGCYKGTAGVGVFIVER